MSFLSRPPSFVKNLNPFLLNGRWLAVIMMDPSHAPPALTFSKIVAMNMAGVDARPASNTWTSSSQKPCNKPSKRSDPDTRGSLPTAIVTSSLPVFSRSHFANPAAMWFASFGVRLGFSPSMPSMAIPLISLPFCSFLYSLISFSSVICQK